MSRRNRNNYRRNLDDLKKKLTGKGGGNIKQDERFWKLTQDAAGNGMAIIRFLPSRVPTDDFSIRQRIHLFAFGGGGYATNPKARKFFTLCPKTLGWDKPCPVCETLDFDNDPDGWRARKRLDSFIANILIVKDAANPENEGKIMLYKFGKKIMDMISAKMFPTDEELASGIEPVVVYDEFEGMNFKLQVYKNGQKLNQYSRSEFLPASPIAKTDAKVDEILGFNPETEEFEKCYDLQDFMREDNFPAYEDIKKRFDLAMGNKSSGATIESKSQRQSVKKSDLPKEKDITENLDMDVELDENDSGESEDSGFDDFMNDITKELDQEGDTFGN